MPNPQMTDIVRSLERQVREELNDRLPRRVGVIAVNHFNQNFRDAGWRDNGLHPWQETIRQREGKGADAKRTPLISAAPHLSRSIEARPRPGAVRIINAVPYAKIHNEGGELVTHPTVTNKLRKMAWARVYAIAKGLDGKLPKDLPEDARKWKAIALTKKDKLSINVRMPKRQFIGNSSELLKKIDDTIISTIQRLMNNAR